MEARGSFFMGQFLTVEIYGLKKRTVFIESIYLVVLEIFSLSELLCM